MACDGGRWAGRGDARLIPEPAIAEEAEPERTSALLARLARDMPEERITMRALVAALGDRGFAIILLVLAVPNSLPIPSPPGFSTVFGVPLAFFSIQMMLGRPRPWLPERMLRRSIARADFRRIVTRILPWLERLERYCRPRGRLLTGLPRSVSWARSTWRWPSSWPCRSLAAISRRVWR